MEKFLVVIEKAVKNYSAYSPDVLGCISTGNTIDETLQNFKEALEFHLEGLAEENMPLPSSISLEEHLKKGNIYLNEDIIIASLQITPPKQLVA
ncbi:MAG: type II toxin-antitoxin system HicB family antitoxin [Chitinophagaceae bacterium]